MMFYKIRIDLNTDLIGIYPQINELTIDYKLANADRFPLIDEWNLNENLPNLKSFKLDSRAKITDVLSNSFVNEINGLFISHDSFSIFSKFILHNVNKYDILIKNIKDNMEYYLISYKSGIEQINFKKSTFFSYNVVRKEYYDRFVINAITNFKEKNLDLLLNTNNKLYPKKIHLFNQVDLISLLGCTGDIIVSERLINAIEEAKLTGFQFKDLDYEVVVE